MGRCDQWNGCTTHDLTSGDATTSSVADFAYSIPDRVFYGVARVLLSRWHANQPPGSVRPMEW